MTTTTYQNETFTTNTTLAEALIVCGRYGDKNFKLTGDMIGAETYQNYTHTVRELWENYVALFAAERNNGEALIERDEAFQTLRKLFALIGEVNGAKLRCTNQTVHALGKLAGKVTTKWNFEVREAMKQRNERRKEFKKAELQAANMPPEHEYNVKLAECKIDLEKAEEKVEKLQAVAYNGVKISEAVSYKEFTVAVQVFLYEAIINRKAKTLEEVLAEEEALKQERKARRQAKRRADAAKN